MKKLVQMACVWFTVCAVQGAVVEDDFESYAVGDSVAGLNGWTVANATTNQNALVAATNSPFSGGGQALYYNDNDDTASLGNLMLQNTLSENITEGVFSFDYNLDYAGWKNPTFFIQDETTGQIGVQLVIRDGNIMYKNGAGSTVTIANSALAYDTWYHIEITVADITGTADTFDLRVVKEDLGSGSTEIVNETGLEFYNDIDTMTRIDIGTWTANGGIGTRFHLDNVQVVPGPLSSGSLAEDFESYAVDGSVFGFNGWAVASATTNQNAWVAATNSPFSGGGQALYYNDSDTNAALANLMLKNTLPKNITEGVFSFDYNLDSTGWFNPTFFIQDETTGNIGIQLVIRDGNIKYKNGAGSTIEIANSALAYDTWYHFEITVEDVTGTADTFDLHITEEDLGSGTTEIANETGLEFYNDVDTMTRIDFGTWAANGAEGTRFLLDNVQVVSGATGYAAWAGDWGVNIGSETSDYDLDGLLNIHEYGLGGNPIDELDQGISPVFGIVEDGGSNVFSYIYPQLSDPDSGLTYSLELNTTDLSAGTWTKSGYTVAGTNIVAGTMDYVTNVTSMTADQKFIRLIIE